MDQTPTIGRIVHYVTDGRTDTYELPAVITCTRDSHPNTEASLEVVPMPDEGCVHLSVMTPGPTKIYTELNVPYSEDKINRSWHWPERV